MQTVLKKVRTLENVLETVTSPVEHLKLQRRLQQADNEVTLQKVLKKRKTLEKHLETVTSPVERSKLKKRIHDYDERKKVPLKKSRKRKRELEAQYARNFALWKKQKDKYESQFAAWKRRKAARIRAKQRGSVNHSEIDLVFGFEGSDAASIARWSRYVQKSAGESRDRALERLDWIDPMPEWSEPEPEQPTLEDLLGGIYVRLPSPGLRRSD